MSVAEFMGALGWTDCSMDPAAGTVTIHRQPRDLTASLPAELAQQLRGAFVSLPASALDSAGTKYSEASRSPRPFVLIDIGWHAEWAGKGIEDVFEQASGEAVAKAAEAGFGDGRDLEGWSLPVTDLKYTFMVTPAGEWPLTAATA